MPKTLTIIFSASPYSGQHAATAARIAEAALARGHRVNLHAAGDGVHAFTVGQRAKGVPHAEESFNRLIARGLRVDL